MNRENKRTKGTRASKNLTNNVEILIIKKNLRYQLIKRGKGFFLLDKDKPYLLILLVPFSYWFFPQKVIKISEESANALQTIPSKDIQNRKLSLYSVGISALIASLIQPVLNYFYLPITPLISGVIVVLLSVVLLCFRFLISKRNKKTLFKHLDITSNVEHSTLWIYPSSIKNMIKLTFLSLFAIVFTAGAMYGFIISGNIIILLIYILLFFVLIIFNLTTIQPGQDTTKVRWIGKKRG